MISASGYQSSSAVLDLLLPNLESKGFRVFLHPSDKVLPPFMRTYQPDAIAIKKSKKIAIEVVSGEEAGGEKLRRLQELFSNHPDWELQVIYAPPRTADQEIAAVPRQVILQNLTHVLDIYDRSGPIPALLTGWSVFEAAARSLLPDNLGRPQTPAQLLQILAQEGFVTLEEADALRDLARMRNEAAHGRLDITLTREEIEHLVNVTRSALALSEKGSAQD